MFRSCYLLKTSQKISDNVGYRKIIFIGNLDGNALFKRIFSQNFPIKKLFDYALIKYTIVLIIKFSDKNDLTGVP